MGILADRLEKMRVTVVSKDGQITATLRPPMTITVSFRDGTFDHYRERTLERQLSMLLRDGWNDYLKARRAAVAEATGRAAEPYEPWDARERRLLAERERTVFEGMSPRRDVYVSSTGLRHWQVVLRDGCLAALTEAEIDSELNGGFAAMMRDYHAVSARLRDKFLST